MMRRSVELEPLNPHFQYCLGNVYRAARRWDDCYVALTKLSEMDSTFMRRSVRSWVISYYKVKGDTGKVMQLYRQGIAESQPGSRDCLLSQFDMNVFAGHKSDALNYLRLCDALKGKDAMNPGHFAISYAALRDKEKTMYWLERLYETHDTYLGWVNALQNYDFLRGDPRFEALMKKAGYRD